MTINTEIREVVANELDFISGGTFNLVTESTVEEVEARYSFIIRGLARIFDWF